VSSKTIETNQLNNIITPSDIIKIKPWPISHYPQGFSAITSINQVSHRLRIYDAHMNLPARGPASTNLPARSPTLRTYPPVVQHMWSTSYVPPHTQHLSNVSTEHMNLPRSYPHMSVT